MNKNLVIGVLAALLVLGALWGQVGNKTNKAARHELEAVTAELEQVKEKGAKAHDQLLAEIAKMEKKLQSRDQQLVKARRELVGLRKSGKALESRVSERDAAVAALTQKKNQLAGQIAALKESLSRAAASGQQQADAVHKQMVKMKKMMQQKDQQLAAAMKALSESKAVKQQLHSTAAEEAQGVQELQAKLEKAESKTRELQAKQEKSEAMIQELQEKTAAAEEAAEAAMDQSKLAREYESVRAQVIGLEKIVEEKNATIEETSKELDHWKVNMDVLLSKISDQQDAMQELREENRELVKELTVKNKELADLNEQLIQTPVSQQ